jgi:hypothetical protein
MAKTFWTIGEYAAEHQVPEWLVRRVVDGLGVQIPRAGQYRLIPHDLLDRLGEELRRRGCPTQTTGTQEAAHAQAAASPTHAKEHR